MHVNSFPPAVLLILGALVLPFLPRRIRPSAFLLFPALGLLLLSYSDPGARLVVPFLDFELVVYRVDRLSLAFGYVFTMIAFLGGLYGFHLMSLGEQVAALLYAGSALGVVFAGDLFTLFVFWEIMAVSSVYLIWARQSERSNRAGLRYLLVHLFGGSFLLVGILWRLAETGSLLFGRLESGPPAYLILFGFALSAAVPPLHAWLSDSYPEATVSGAVFLSAFTTKAAVYVLARGFASSELLMWAGAVMAIYGVVFAVLENDIRRILAYHIISQVGYMVCGVGIGTETAINGATAHAFAHILYKGLLFMGAGAVLQATGLSKLTELGGLGRSLRLALYLYMVGAFSISGFPLFSGFVSKSLVVHAAEISHQGWVALLLHGASIGTFLGVGLKLPYFTWYGPDRSLKVVSLPWSMYAAMAIAGGINIAIGLYPEALYRVMPFPVEYEPYTLPHLSETIQLLGFTGLGFWLMKGRLGGKSTITLDVDWFYRRPARLLHRVMVVSLDHVFASVESVTIRVVKLLAEAARNPVAFLPLFERSVARPAKSPSNATSSTDNFDPDRYRLPVGLLVLVLILSFTFLLIANLIGSYFSR